VSAPNSSRLEAKVIADPNEASRIPVRRRDKGADKPYRLLAATGRGALAQTVFHNKESLVLIS
jgi:hypothetical protein